MVTRTGFVRVSIAVGFCIIIFLFMNQRDVQDYPRIVKYTEPIQDDETISYNVTAPLVTITDIVKHQQMLLDQRFADYPFTSNLKYSDLSLAYGGQPVRSIIITTWRSGSTFLGDVLNAVPGNYYHYEPLLDYGIVQIRGPPFADSQIWEDTCIFIYS